MKNAIILLTLVSTLLPTLANALDQPSVWYRSIDQERFINTGSSDPTPDQAPAFAKHLKENPCNMFAWNSFNQAVKNSKESVQIQKLMKSIFGNKDVHLRLNVTRSEFLYIAEKNLQDGAKLASKSSDPEMKKFTKENLGKSPHNIDLSLGFYTESGGKLHFKDFIANTIPLKKIDFHGNADPNMCQITSTDVIRALEKFKLAAKNDSESASTKTDDPSH